MEMLARSPRAVRAEFVWSTHIPNYNPTANER